MTGPEGRRIVLALTALLSGGLSAPAGAENLEDAWALALANDRGLAAVRSQAESAELDAAAAKLLEDPQWN